MRSPVPSLPLVACATALAVASAARPCLAQASGRASIVRGVAVEAGILAPGAARATAAFGGGLDLGLGGSRLLRIGVTGWVAESPGGGAALHGRDVSVLWLLRSGPLGGAGWRLFAAAGPALAGMRAGDSASPPTARAAAAAQAGFALPLSPEDGLALELRLGGLAPVTGRAQLSLRLALRVNPGQVPRLLAGEPAPPPTVAAQPAQPAPSPTLDTLPAVGAGVLAPARVGGALRLEEAAFDSGGTDLTREAAARLARVGGTLRALGAEPLRVMIYSADTTAVGARRASLRAVSVARALARGGYPAARLVLEVAPPAASAAGVGRILAGAPCVSDCVAPATRPPR